MRASQVCSNDALSARPTAGRQSVLARQSSCPFPPRPVSVSVVPPSRRPHVFPPVDCPLSPRLPLPRSLSVCPSFIRRGAARARLAAPPRAGAARELGPPVVAGNVGDLWAGRRVVIGPAAVRVSETINLRR